MLYQNYSLIPHNTFGLNVATKYFFEYSSEEELRNFLKSELFQSNSYLHIGAGSNLLFLNDFKFELFIDFKLVFKIEKNTGDSGVPCQSQSLIKIHYC